MGRYQQVTAQNEITTVANTDIITDYDILEDGILTISYVSADTADLRVTLDGTNYSTIHEANVDVWATVNIAVRSGDVFNIQTVGIEVISLRIIFDQG